jgi:hypothetical protein
LRGQRDGVGDEVLLEAGDLLRPGDEDDVLTLGEQPGQRDLGLVRRESSASRPSIERIAPVRKPRPSGE